MVIDDAVAANDVEKMLLRSAAPEGCNTSILSLRKPAPISSPATTTVSAY
jgi:mannose/fructose/N-acetylgalactosamine-specific phosphotransferase system component IIB